MGAAIFPSHLSPTGFLWLRSAQQCWPGLGLLYLTRPEYSPSTNTSRFLWLTVETPSVSPFEPVLFSLGGSASRALQLATVER